MINHPLTILQRMLVFAKPGLIRRKPPVQVGEGTCQVREGNLSSSVIRLGKCQGADAQEQRCCSSQIPNHKSSTPPPPTHFISSTHSPITNPSTSTATHSKAVGSVNSSQPITTPGDSGSLQACWSSASRVCCGSDHLLPTYAGE